MFYNAQQMRIMTVLIRGTDNLTLTPQQIWKYMIKFKNHISYFAFHFNKRLPLTMKTDSQEMECAKI